MHLKSTYQLNNFQEDVLDTSQHIPVLVDYWASWCDPCKFLGPIIEKLADEAKGKWKLVKVNTEEHSDIVAEWGIRGIPNLKLFYKRKVIADLAGAMAEADMRNWLDDKLPSKAKSMAIEASQLIATGSTDKGIELLEKAIDLDHNLKEARLLLAKLIVWNNPARIPSLVHEIKHVEEAEELILLSEFMDYNFDELEKGEVRAILIKVNKLLLDKKIEPAIELLIEAVIVNKNYQNELARKLALAIFHILGESNELTKNYRRKFDMALY
jgi:putative thioredoxin